MLTKFLHIGKCKSTGKGDITDKIFSKFDFAGMTRFRIVFSIAFILDVFITFILRLIFFLLFILFEIFVKFFFQFELFEPLPVFFIVEEMN